MKLNDNTEHLLRKSYYRKDADGNYIENSWEDVCDRVSRSIAKAEKPEDYEKWRQIFYDMMVDMTFIPSTPCLINANEDGTGQLSSCFILDIKDTIESIYEVKAECAKIFQKNGGCGFNISALRPRGTPVETSGGASCGVTGWMEEFDLTADVVTRNNVRKGAIKIDLAVWHPDIYDFLKVKDDTTKLQHMNISVAMTNRFMSAVCDDEDWKLVFPDFTKCKDLYNKEWNGNIDEWEGKGYPIKVYKTVKAKDLYRDIMEHAWKTGEPGVSFIDTMDADNPNPHCGHINGTNPCFTGDMQLLTKDGYKSFVELEGKEVEIVNADGNISLGKVWCSGEKQTVYIRFSNHKSIKCTPDHVFMDIEGLEVKAIDLLGRWVKGFDGEAMQAKAVIPDWGVFKVYDFSEPLTHWGVVNNAVVHNCAEFCSVPYNSCNLGSLNLTKFVKDKDFDYSKLEIYTDYAVRFLDDMITVNKLPIEKIEKTTKALRSVGLGTMGFADALLMMGIEYGSTYSETTTNEIYAALLVIAQSASKILCREKGAYDKYIGSVWNTIDSPVRNSNFLSIAPNGSISTIANVSGGIEPNFAFVMTRTLNDGTKYNMVNPVLLNELNRRGLYSEELIQKIADNGGRVRGIDEIPEDMQKVFVTAQEITPEQHIKATAIAQEYVDLSISKTINLPNSATIEDVMNVYMSAWEQGLKGVTIYRDGSRETQVLTTNETFKDKGKPNESTDWQLNSLIPITRKELGVSLRGATYAAHVACGKLYITINHDDKNHPVEVFVDTGKSGGCRANSECLGRAASSMLRCGMRVEDVIDTFKSVRCDACRHAQGTKQLDGVSCGDVVARTLEKEWNVLNVAKQEMPPIKPFVEDEPIKSGINKCPECGAELIHESGCIKCLCGWSKCS